MSDPWQAICDVWSIEPEDHATRSRDYGRGFADAIKRVRAAIETHGITFEEDTRSGCYAPQKVFDKRTPDC